MDPHSPYAGTLLIPDKPQPGDSPVRLPGGEVVVKIRRPMLPIRNAFEIVDPDGESVAYGRTKGFVRPCYPLLTPDGLTLLELALGLRGGPDHSTVTLPDGRQLSATGSWWVTRRFSILDGDSEVATIQPTSGAGPVHPDSYVFDVRQPVLSIVQAVGLAQSLRAAVKPARSVHAPQGGGQLA